MTSFWSKAAAEAASHGSRGDMLPAADSLNRRLAEEIAYARRMLTVAANELARDPTMVTRHASALRSFDNVSQMLGHLADVLGSNDPDGAVDRVAMADLKARLKRRSLT